MAKSRRARQTEGERGADLRREEIVRRLTEVEEVARANRRELELQFRRMADMQTEIDRLKRR